MRRQAGLEHDDAVQEPRLIQIAHRLRIPSVDTATTSTPAASASASTAARSVASRSPRFAPSPTYALTTAGTLLPWPPPWDAVSSPSVCLRCALQPPRPRLRRCGAPTRFRPGMVARRHRRRPRERPGPACRSRSSTAASIRPTRSSRVARTRRFSMRRACSAARSITARSSPRSPRRPRTASGSSASIRTPRCRSWDASPDPRGITDDRRSRDPCRRGPAARASSTSASAARRRTPSCRTRSSQPCATAVSSSPRQATAASWEAHPPIPAAWPHVLHRRAPPTRTNRWRRSRRSARRRPRRARRRHRRRRAALARPERLLRTARRARASPRRSSPLRQPGSGRPADPLGRPDRGLLRRSARDIGAAGLRPRERVGHPRHPGRARPAAPAAAIRPSRTTTSTR